VEAGDIIRIRRATPQEREKALELLLQFGDSLSNLRQHHEIPEDALEGSPANLQDFSCKNHL